MVYGIVVGGFAEVGSLLMRGVAGFVDVLRTEDGGDLRTG